MTEAGTNHRTPAIWGRASQVAALIVTAVVCLAVGFQVGRGESEVQWREGAAYVGEGQASIRVEDWGYGITDSVAWIDGKDEQHDSGWPTCLDVPAGTTIDSVRFATVDVDADGTGWREVVLVDCRR